MYTSITHPRTGPGLAIILSLAMLGFLFAAIPVHADVDPVDCTDNGGGISLAAFRSDGTTNIGSGTVSDGELIKYKATLSALGTPNCAFEGGTWTLTTPDGVAHPLGAVPRIGGSGVASFSSSLISYTVNHSDEIVNSTRHINAITNYGGGISHADANDETDGPVLQASKITKVVHTPAVATNIHDTNHAVITDAPIGSSVHDNAAVTGEIGGPAPTGTVDFKRYNNTTCDGSPANTESGVALTAGVAESSSTAVPNTGMSYLAHYNGDSNYNPADAECEPLTADKLTPTVVTVIHNASEQVVTSAPSGSTVHDKATVSGSGPTPTGTVDFTFWNNDSCDSVGAPAGTGVALDGSGVAHPSDSQGPLVPGSYSFRATYSGDDNYVGNVAADCEPLTVAAFTPAISTTLSATPINVGGTVHDSATLTGASSDAGGSVTYTVYTDSACSQNPVDAGTVSVTNHIVPDSNPITFNVTGDYYWQATYSGDSNNAGPVSSNCTEEHLVVQQIVQYCSPGYWKQPKHFHNYPSPYTSGTLFSAVFDNAFPGKTLVQVLSQGGGGLNMLGRATVGALLNAGSMNSGLTTAQVISIFDAAYPGTSTDYQNAANQFTAPENCPLN